MAFWLFKSEPYVFNIDDLANRPKQIEPWNGVRNYQARNMLRDHIKKGDQAFFYYSSIPAPGVAGIMDILQSGVVEETQNNTTWYMAYVRFKKKFSRFITLEEIKAHPKLKTMQVARRGNRLSITPVTKEEWHIILKLSLG